jgi:hypothetical protein
MFTNKQFIRNVVFGVFCVLILCISLALVYYITLFDEKVEIPVVEVDTNLCDKSGNMLLSTFIIKIMAAFFAGGLVSDRLFLKIGII